MNSEASLSYKKFSRILDLDENHTSKGNDKYFLK